MRSGWLVVAAALLAAGCSEDFGVVFGERLVVVDCDGEDEARTFAPFRMECDVLSFEAQRGPVYIRMQRDGEPATDGDSFALHIPDLDALKAALAANPERGVPFGGADGLVHGALVLASTCPDNYQPLVAVGGAVRFAEIGDDVGERVRLEMTDFALRDVRKGEVVGVGFGGEADFEIRVGPPWVAFDE